MRCPNCNSEDIQFISDVKTKNMSFLWILFCILTVGIGLIFWLIYIASKNTKTDTKAICKNCGEQWHVSKPKKKASIGGILLLIIIVGGAMGAYYYFGGNNKSQEFDIQYTNITTEWADRGNGGFDTEIVVYGDITANIQCNRIFLKCEVYSSNNVLICTTVNTFNISNGQTLSFRLSALPLNSEYTSKPLSAKNFQVTVLS